MDYRVIGNIHARFCLIEPVGEWDDAETLFREVSTLCHDKDFSLVAVRVNRWNDDLSPWETAPVFGTEGFGAGAADTLSYIENTILPDVASEEKTLILGGYSLAGLFSLWAAVKSNRFSACAAASPSVWFPGWIDYVSSQKFQTQAVYLSLGNKEEHTRNTAIAHVGECIRQQETLLSGIRHTLVWNEGNHFRDATRRMAMGFAWCINQVS